MRKAMKILAMSSLALTLAACQTGYELNTDGDDDDDGGSDSSTSGTYIGAGNGSYWELSFPSEDTFELVEFDSSLTALTDAADPESDLEGDVVIFDTGFYELTVTDDGDDDDDVDSSSVFDDKVNLFFVSDVLAIVHPIESGDDELVFLIDNDCPGSAFDGNFIATDIADGELNTTTPQVFGTYGYASASVTITLEDIFSVDEDFTRSDDTNVPLTASSDCDDGVTGDAEGSEFYLSGDDIAIFPNGTNRYLGLDGDTIDDVTDTDNDYIGYLDNNDIVEVTALCENGTCTISELNDIETLDDTTEIYTLTFDDIGEPEAGFIEGTLASVEESSNFGYIACNYDEIDGEVFLACVGQSPEEQSSSVNLYLYSF